MRPREILAVRYGTLRATKGELFHELDSGEPQSLDYFFWVLRSDDATVLVDSGFDPEVAARRGRECLCPPVEALRRLGIDSVDRVVVTHFHYEVLAATDGVLVPGHDPLVMERFPAAGENAVRVG